MDKRRFERGAGVLCHISSLPGKYGIGSLGKEAYDFVDFLERSKIKYWQILPLVQTGYGDSPYQSVCCNSGNPYFIDLEELYRRGLLDAEELKEAQMPAGRVDYGELYKRRYATLRRAYARFNIRGKDFSKFVESGLFDDYALFMSLKSVYGGTFRDFPKAYKFKEKLAIDEFRANAYKKEYCFWQFLQYEFLCQWKKLKEYANSKGIKIIGDIPLYMAADSSDVWAHPEMFLLDEDLNPAEVAGVPPDYFSATGQLWGNPLYDWGAAEKDGYRWWINRIQRAFELYDIVRVDHFRGFDRYYAIPAGSPTAEVGEWRQGPGIKLFEAMERAAGHLNFIAEDLGVIDDGVVALRDETGFPGMKIMLFAFDGNAENEYLPQYIGENTVTYTGTHDNDTALGFVEGMTDERFAEFRKLLREALKYEGVSYPIVSREDAARAIVKCALGAKSDMCIVPVQDVLGLDNSARMNVPSTPSGNWQFRLEEIPSRRVAAWLRTAVKSSGRL
ncbi:MAG TPA: 4-alpha-glucanotransferase [Candidatus Coproplasma stercorigallinarum]|nr:4-alpha-glucanotransferase [Candidatus Coproplasma stercorigallinarum]